MTMLECARETEVLHAVLGRRLDRDRPRDEVSHDPVEELRAHAEACEICRDLVMVASLLRDDRDAARHDIRVPAAGQVWWRAAIRARLEGAHAAARPLTWAQGVAAACAAGLAVGGVGLVWPAVARSITWIETRAEAASPAAFAVADLVSAAVQRSLPFALAAAACLVLAPLALYLALSDE